jgi:hypothetical protein
MQRVRIGIIGTGAIVEAAPVRSNTAEQVRRDIQLLCGLAHWHATHTPFDTGYGEGP